MKPKTAKQINTKAGLLTVGDLTGDYEERIRQEVAREIFEEMLSDELLEVGRKAVEDLLVEWRDNRLSEFLRGNGLVIREKDGKDSSIIRFGPETALRVGIRAMKQALKSKYLPPTNPVGHVDL